MIYTGGCHCGDVLFEFESSTITKVTRCNCSICTQSGYLHIIVPKSRFMLLTAEDNITTYTFGTHTAKHTFCKRCGIKSFYSPRSHPDSFSVNAHCVKNLATEGLHIQLFDGINWEESIKTQKE